MNKHDPFPPSILLTSWPRSKRKPFILVSPGQGSPEIVAAEGLNGARKAALLDKTKSDQYSLNGPIAGAKQEDRYVQKPFHC